jgi:hypothetical protein
MTEARRPETGGVSAERNSPFEGQRPGQEKEIPAFLRNQFAAASVRSFSAASIEASSAFLWRSHTSAQIKFERKKHNRKQSNSRRIF